LPAGRIDFKLARLTCNFPDGASKTWDVAGWLVDPDGIRGVRARIVQNAGRKAVVAAGGGALSGLGRRLSHEQYQINAGALASSSTFIGNATHDALGGSAEGAAVALGQSIADYYNLYAPSLQVGGGTLVSLVIANELKFPASGRGLTETHTTP
jgi:conjugal transfer pilus assembly protein TraB